MPKWECKNPIPDHVIARYVAIKRKGRRNREVLMDNRFCGKGLFVYAVICLFGKSVEIHLIRLNQWRKKVDLVNR